MSVTFNEKVANIKLFVALIMGLLFWFFIIQPLIMTSSTELVKYTIFFEPLDSFIQSFTHTDIQHLIGNIAILTLCSVLIIPFVRTYLLLIFMLQIIIWGFFITFIEFGSGVGFSSEISALAGIAFAIYVRNYYKSMYNELDFSKKQIVLYGIILVIVCISSLTDLFLALGIIPIDYDGILSFLIHGFEQQNWRSVFSHSLGFVFGIMIYLSSIWVDYKESILTEPVMNA